MNTSMTSQTLKTSDENASRARLAGLGDDAVQNEFRLLNDQSLILPTSAMRWLSGISAIWAAARRERSIT